MDLELILTMALSFDEERPAVSDLEGRTLSTGQLDSYAASAASMFLSRDVERVAFCETNGIAFPVALFGAVKARLPLVPLNYRLADEQLARIVTGERLVAVCSPEQGMRLRKLGVEHVLESEEFLSAAAEAEPTIDPPPLDTDDVALLLYTSGTTGIPKAAVLRHRHLAAYVINTVEFASAGAEEATLLSVPPYHIAGVMNLLSNLYMGRRIVYLESFTADRWLEAVREHSVSHAMMVPTMLARVVNALDDKPAEAPSLRTVAYGGARMPRAVIESALQLFPEVAFTNAYGLTETSSTVSVLGPEIHRDALTSDDPTVQARLGSVGVPLPGIEIEIRDDDGHICGPNVAGNIFIRGEQVAGEYLNDSSNADGWFGTRDWGYLDDDGYLFVEGRTDDTIIRGGENISPAEVEDVLLAHDEVSDCAVVGIEDEEWGQRIAAAVVLVPGATVEVDDLRNFARTNLRGSKTPDQIVVVDELPYTDTGKLLRRVVREQLST